MSESFRILDWCDLNREEFHDFLKLRIDVFVVEQNCTYQELDGKDEHSIHVYKYNSEGVEAYLRIVKPGVSYDEPSIGRVATVKSSRNKGLGKEIMRSALKECDSRWPNQGVRISAQKYLVKFYEDMGFKVCSEPYLEDDIPHVQMYKA